MTKQSAIGSSLLIAKYDVSGDIGALSGTNFGRDVIEVTSIQDVAPYRIAGRKHGEMAFQSYWNTAAGQAVPVFQAMPTTDVLSTIAIAATAVGDPAASMPAKQLTYDPAYGADGSLTASVNMESTAAVALEWGQVLTTGKQTFASGSVNGTSIDFGATSTLFGAAAYLHAISLGSGTVTVKVQDSADNSSFADVTGMAFTAVTTGTSERVQGAVNATVRRYVRINVSGTYTNLVALVNFIRYLVNPNT